ncbi:MAG: hypothetical protein LBT29_00980 [Flavobacteriaceae bacterium]|jgi:hypothetical protein|nr:hypothetical protein [Flavobacteriaceae bacterium]
MGFLDQLFSRKKNKDDDDEPLNLAHEENMEITFIKNFKAGNGMFFYCEDKQEALEQLKQIFVNEDITEVLCVDGKLISFINVLDCYHSSEKNKHQDIAFITCEYLIVLDGSVMISSDQTHHLKKSDLPEKIIIWAHPDQIISTSSVGLAKIRFNKQDNIPANITALHGNQMQGFTDIATAKKLYLLLVEEKL